MVSDWEGNGAAQETTVHVAWNKLTIHTAPRGPVEGGHFTMHSYLVDAKKAKLGPASWRIGMPFPRGGRIELPSGRFDPGRWTAVHMNGVTTIDRGGKYPGVFTYGLTGCFCSALVLMRNGVVHRIVLNHYTTNPRWKEIVANLGKRRKDDTIYLVLAEAGGGRVGAAEIVRDYFVEAGLKRNEVHTYFYARSVHHPVSFGISLERYAGEVPAAAVKALPPMGWAK